MRIHFKTAIAYVGYGMGRWAVLGSIERADDDVEMGENGLQRPALVQDARSPRRIRRGPKRRGSDA